MNVKNRKCIRRLGFRQFRASGMRNLIAVAAVTLTALLFTSLFTIAMSITKSYEEYNFRQAGGYCHGTFKEVNQEQIEKITAHPKVKETGARTVAGYLSTEGFAKVPAEVSYMDENCTKWSYAIPKEGRMPQKGMEVSMDTTALKELGAEPVLGEEITMTYPIRNSNAVDGEEVCRTDTFTLVGFWEYDNVIPVHYINVSKEYMDMVEKDWLAEEKTEEVSEPFRIDLNVMLASSVNIEGVMQSIDTDLGYQWEDREGENCVRIGVNWGYVASEMNSKADPMLIASIAAFVLLVVFTGYLIIYNVFRISVTNDIRFYGMLKTIGTTPRQLKRIIRIQALVISTVGIPLGLVLGFIIGSLLLPRVLSGTMDFAVAKLSMSPMIFLGASLFSLVTVLLSVSKPGRIAAKVSPIEALRYTESAQGKKKTRKTKGADVFSMAWANMGRSKSKTLLVVLSLSLAVVLLTSLFSFVRGFDMEKYVSKQTAGDFLLSKTEYMRSHYRKGGEALPEEILEMVRKNTSCELEGSAYSTVVNFDYAWLTEDLYRKGSFQSGEMLEREIKEVERKNGLLKSGLQIEALDESLFEKLTVIEGDITPLKQADSHEIAICVSVDDYGKPYGEYPKIGDTIPVSYIESCNYYDSRTGELADDATPYEYMEEEVKLSNEVEYQVCALVVLPYKMGYRYKTEGFEALLSKEQLKNDSRQELARMFYLFDTPGEEEEALAEEFLAELTENDSLGLAYESKKIIRDDFKNFRNMFLLLGGVLCFIVAVIGILNFLNAILTGIITRRREFAMLQSIGMTGRQLKTMLVWEGLLYALFSLISSLIFCLLIEPLAGNMFENMFWFFTARFTMLPAFCVIPVFLLLGIVLPLLAYRAFSGKSIVERLRESDV